MKSLKLLNVLLTTKDKKYLGVLLALSIAISIFETISISAIMVFISIATNFDLIHKNSYYNYIYIFSGASSPASFVIMLGSALIIFYLFRGVLNVGHVYLMSRFSQMRYYRYATHLFGRFLNFPYQDFIGMNSAAISHAIFTHTGGMTHFIFAVLTIFAEFFTMICIYIMLFFVNWKMTLVLTLFLTTKSYLIFRTFSRRTTAAGKDAHKGSLESYRLFNESVGNLKIIKLASYDQQTTAVFSHSIKRFSSAQILFMTLQNTPRFMLETIGFLVLIGVILYVIYRYQNAAFVIPMVSMYALAFYRFLPSLNKILASLNQLNFSEHALQGIHDFLQLPTESLGHESVSFTRIITLQSISFCYQKDKEILSDISITIAKGERVAFVGRSGSGKSTLLDVVMGLLKPTNGAIFVDGIVLDVSNIKSWREKIGYIPQAIYLFDGTVAQNVVFGRSYDEAKVITALRKAQLHDILESKLGINMPVGEGGIKISGGQKQRIAFARALYNDPALLILDEATSALDHATESCIMDEIYRLDKDMTIAVVAHRTSTIARCDTIYKLENGVIQRVTFEDVWHYGGQRPLTQHV